MIHQWSVVKLVEVLNNKPINVTSINEAYTSTTDPFTWKRVKTFSSLNDALRVEGRKIVKVVKLKFRLRIAENELDGDVTGAINLGLRYLNGRLMALGLTESVWLKLMIPHIGLTQTMDLKVLRNK